MRQCLTICIVAAAVILVGCSRKSVPPPADLIEVIKQRAFALPKELIHDIDGSEPEYVMVVRQIKITSENRKSSFRTHSVEGEWCFANGYKNPDVIIAVSKKSGCLFAADFVVAKITETNAVVNVFLSKGRHGFLRRWLFDRGGGKWELAKDDRMGFWD